MAEDFFGGFAKGLQGGMAIGVQRQGIQLRREENERQERQFGQTFGLQQQKLKLDQETEERLRQNQTWHQQSEDAKAAAQKKVFELGIMESLQKSLEPGKYSLPFRTFALTQGMKHMGMDPSSKEGKDLIGLLTKLPEEELAPIRSALADAAPHLSLEQLGEYAKGVVSGRITLKDLLAHLQSASIGEARTDAAIRLGPGGATQSPPGGGGAAPGPGGAPAVSPAPAEGQQGTAPIEGPAARKVSDTDKKVRDLQNEARRLFAKRDDAGARVLLEEAAQIIRLRDTDPENVGLVEENKERAKITVEEGRQAPLSAGGLFGVKGAGKMTRAQLRDDFGVYIDQLDPKATKEALEYKAGYQESEARIDDLKKKVKPEIIGVVGKVVRGWGEFVSQLEGAGNALSGSGITGVDVSKMINSAGLREWVKTDLGVESSILQSQVIELGYTMVKAQKEGRANAQDIQNMLKQLGESGGADQFKAVLTNLQQRMKAGTRGTLESKYGMAPLDMMSREELIAEAQKTPDTNVRKLNAIREIIKGLKD